MGGGSERRTVFAPNVNAALVVERHAVRQSGVAGGEQLGHMSDSCSGCVAYAVCCNVRATHGTHGPSKAAFFGYRWWVCRRVEPGLLFEREAACLAIVRANVPVVASSLVNATITADGIGSEGWLRVKERP